MANYAAFSPKVIRSVRFRRPATSASSALMLSPGLALLPFSTHLPLLGLFLVPVRASLPRALVSPESASFATVKSAKRRGRLTQPRQQTSRVVVVAVAVVAVVVVVVVVVLVSSRCRRFPFSLSLSLRRPLGSRRRASSAKLKTFTSAKETRSRGRPSHKPGHISRGVGDWETSKKLAKAERGWVWGERGTPRVRVWDVRAARAARGNKKKFCQVAGGRKKRETQR